MLLQAGIIRRDDRLWGTQPPRPLLSPWMSGFSVSTCCSVRPRARWVGHQLPK